MNNFWHKLRHDSLAMLSLSIIVGVILLGIFAPWISPNDPLQPHLSEKFASWGSDFPLGSDHLGRCLLSRLLYGIRTTLFLALMTMAITVTLGTILGLIAGYFRKVEESMMRICDVMLSFPSELMILAVVGMLGAGIKHVIIASVIAKVAWYTRMVYSFVLVHRQKNYLLFSQVAGVSSWTILRKHLFPFILDDIAMLATLDTGWVILSISALSFLGLGVQAPTPEWGMMLSEAKNVLSIYPMQMIPSGFAILIVVAAFNFLGDSIRDALDPKHCLIPKSVV
ncbi:nickel/cobalt ABC transporter permease [Sulfurospirillum arcachonense]|uniref:nickel/cobalt ABC transporter permease n=1 Tax=Sulfurospirillum arcachonense TaxID=57666 RepID=UPI0004695C32|nr:nickel/cobalt ABC transporter permease [Sulfurospirillum arcachonense]